MQCVEGAKRICYVLQNATLGRTTPEFLTFLSQSSTELIKALTTKLDEVRNLCCLHFPALLSLRLSPAWPQGQNISCLKLPHIGCASIRGLTAPTAGRRSSGGC